MAFIEREQENRFDFGRNRGRQHSTFYINQKKKKLKDA